MKFGRSTQRILDISGVVPVVVIDDVGLARDLAFALREGGIPRAEVTLRTPEGLGAIAAMSDVPDFSVGAGTVLSEGDVARCVDAGARFIVSPGLDHDVVRRAQDLDVTVLPGIATATEIQAAVALGLTAVKFFPAERLGGLAMIEALSGPFPSLRFMPSGGITAANAATYLAHPAVFAVGGSWMVPRNALRKRDFETVSRLSGFRQTS
ncbi:keto-deoxy-phosphogluconate aldolase [Frondihabitans sp. PAMC 28766]|uniref:bifunctional 4-hydroxy-2-oxoglutarate aldolase/2-dehydro-3-deoxy-phosphogluconate aldolase n=1 Tax=Frondihabitans sp. PAMC 28766 TaxID=1795630 RepID=UPI00078C3ACD|nr:bifunctional 4-hydroxy-2-oxoglutarate aldolase/2-dehydro-3-deoxy-phosphogluconate aldolase [Frondihabitans sp. PAMC 28766]AMM20310.1 keto-deoxy-phosphogluconate aldolase [Frondihabitans sp. PAMC 28766]